MSAGPGGARLGSDPKRRIARIVILVAAAAVYFTLAPRWPKDNVVHIVLGASAARGAHRAARSLRGGHEKWSDRHRLDAGGYLPLS